MTKAQLRQDLILLAIAILAVLSVGAAIFHLLEGWSYVDAFYFVTMTTTTVGYGDFAPTHTLSKIITILYSLSIVPFVLYAFSFIAKSQMERVYHRIHHLERKQKEQEEELDTQEKHIKKSIKAIKQTEEDLEKQKRKLKKEHEINREQTEEISEHDKELEVVEDIMEKELSK